VIQSFLLTYKSKKQISNFYLFLNDFLSYLECPLSNDNCISCNKSFNHVVKNYENYCASKDIAWAHVVWKFQRKNIKIPFVVSCPKPLCCQNKVFEPVGVEQMIHIVIKRLISMITTPSFWDWKAQKPIF